MPQFLYFGFSVGSSAWMVCVVESKLVWVRFSSLGYSSCVEDYVAVFIFL